MENTVGFHDAVIRQKCAGRQVREMYVESSSDNASANKLNDAGERVGIVTLDEDVEDTITFLKMDIVGTETLFPRSSFFCAGRISLSRVG